MIGMRAPRLFLYNFLTMKISSSSVPSISKSTALYIVCLHICGLKSLNFKKIIICLWPLPII